MSIETLDFNIGEVSYTFVQADVFKTKDHAEMLMSLAKGAFKISGKEDGSKGFDFNVDPAEVLSNITSSESKKVQDFIFNTIKVVVNGEAVPFATKSDQSKHLGVYRSHIYQLLIEGAKYHFLPFIPTGEEFAKSMIGQAINKYLAQM